MQAIRIQRTTIILLLAYISAPGIVTEIRRWRWWQSQRRRRHRVIITIWRAMRRRGNKKGLHDFARAPIGCFLVYVPPKIGRFVSIFYPIEEKVHGVGSIPDSFTKRRAVNELMEDNERQSVGIPIAPRIYRTPMHVRYAVGHGPASLRTERAVCYAKVEALPPRFQLRSGYYSTILHHECLGVAKRGKLGVKHLDTSLELFGSLQHMLTIRFIRHLDADIGSVRIIVGDRIIAERDRICRRDAAILPKGSAKRIEVADCWGRRGRRMAVHHDRAVGSVCGGIINLHHIAQTMIYQI